MIRRSSCSSVARNCANFVGKTPNRGMYNNLRSAVSNAVTGVVTEARTTLLEVLAKRMNRKDADMIAKYAKDIINSHNSNYPEKTIQTEVIDNVLQKSNSKTQSKQTVVDVSPVNEQTHEKPQVEFKLEPVSDNSLLHPVFGEQIASLGYKTVYLSNVRRLALSPVWKKQRILRPERSQKIANAKIKEGSHGKLSGVISLYCSENNTSDFGIVDGQHRVGALVLLAQAGLISDMRRNILVDVYHTKEEKEVEALFREINSGEPVRLIDLDSACQSVDKDIDNENNEISSTPTNSTPPSSTVSTASTVDVRIIITEAVDELAVKYASMFKSTSRCRPPHVHADTLRDDLYQNNYCSRFNLKSSSDLIQKIESVNKELGKKYSGELSKGKSKGKESEVVEIKLDAAETKAKTYEFYLGLNENKNWMNQK